MISEGTPINVTLLFAVDSYLAVAEAYMSGLERFAAAGGDLSQVASVASFFVSRIDTLVDERLEKLAAAADAPKQKELRRLQGKVAIANARIAYSHYQQLIASDSWRKLAAQGARPQRLLWASTSTKNPNYPKTLYVDELIGPDTVNTIPAETFAAFRESGKPTNSLTEGGDSQAAQQVMDALAATGISMQDVTDTLLEDAIKKFSDPYAQLLQALEAKRQSIMSTTGKARHRQPTAAHA